ncbi:hypothetical protein NP493_168g03036 [Ridgeia piscesae]|uniref:C2H2-type domain-containing protein n=1 Tax=Ridgeia piscesae TaxID=27915 RepID=A0AAD9UFF5_RIDPI|nr:hypothetical protein NP493_168g03036 [Ridgeia piscesae]
MKTVDSWTQGSGGQPAVGLTSPVVTSSGVMDYAGHPMSAFSVSANAGSIPSVLPPHSDPLKAESTPPPLDSMSPSQFGLSFEDFDGEDDEMGWLGRAHARGTSLSRTHSRLNVVMSPLRRDEVCKPTVLPDGRTVYRCTYCNKDFTTLSDINRHMDFHEGIREFHCRLCNYKGVTQSDLNRHTKSQIHVMKAQNVCDQCGEGFVSPKNLQQHYSEKHPALHQMAYSQGYNSL